MSRQIYLFSTSSHPNAVNVNSLDITLLKPQIDFSNYDYFIITSKQASHALKQYEKKEYIDTKALCISKKSAAAFESLGCKILETGSGYGDNLLSIIREYPKTTRWLYLRAKLIASDFVQVAKTENFLIDETIVYESMCSKQILNIEVEPNSVLIFTSPSSVKCFLQNNSIDKSHKIIVIGSTTAKALPVNIPYLISKETTIESCMEITH